jgi:hypothetical protein
MNFLPSFFDIMVHVTIHLAREVKIVSPIQYRWMYHFDMFMFKLKRYVHNKGRPKGSITRGFIAEECMIFCSQYLHDVDSSLTRPERNDDDSSSIEITLFSEMGRDLGTLEMIPLNGKDIARVHVYILMNYDVVKLYAE